MRKLLVIALFSIGLSGCATYSPYGNFVENSAGLNQQKIASDTVEKITELYPPAKTRFEMKQTTPDVFGTAFVTGLRDKGYAILEFDPESVTTTETKEDSHSSQTGLPIHYIFDQFTGTNMYRVTIMLGNKSLTRPYSYSQESGEVIPAGYWVRKE